MSTIAVEIVAKYFRTVLSLVKFELIQMVQTVHEDTRVVEKLQRIKDFTN